MTRLNTVIEDFGMSPLILPVPRCHLIKRVSVVEKEGITLKRVVMMIEIALSISIIMTTRNRSPDNYGPLVSRDRVYPLHNIQTIVEVQLSSKDRALRI